MQTASDQTRLDVLAAVARLQDPTLDKRHARKLAAAGMVRPNGANTQPVVAYINHGRWVADCLCGGAELVDGREMVCGSCGMSTPVKFPGAKTRQNIEGLLALRPVMNQNWRDETVAELTAQNIENGLFPEDM